VDKTSKGAYRMKSKKITFILKVVFVAVLISIFRLILIEPTPLYAKGDRDTLFKTPEKVTEVGKYGTHVGRSGANPFSISRSLTSSSKVFIADNGCTDGSYTDDSGNTLCGDLDQYLFRSDVSTHMDGRLTFAIKIDQYFGDVFADGTLKNIEDLIANHIIPEYVTFQMYVFDVDNEAADPEIDTVYINRTHMVGTENTSWNGLDHLTSGDNTWSINSCTIPTRWLKFPAKPASGQAITPRENIIQIDIDTVYLDYWAIQVDWARLEFGDTNKQIPIVFIHGKGANSLEWSIFNSAGEKSTTGGFREWFENKGFQTYTIDYWNQGNPTRNAGNCQRDTNDGINTLDKLVQGYSDGCLDPDVECPENVKHTTDIVTGTIDPDLKTTNDFRFSRNLANATKTTTTWEGLEQLQELKAAGYDKINIIAHSMGGLVARYYIDNQMKDTTKYPQVVNLFTISTPHHGSAAAGWTLGGLLDNSPAAEFLTPKKVEDFNSQYLNDGKVEYYTIGAYGGDLINIPDPYHWYGDFKDYQPCGISQGCYLESALVPYSLNGGYWWILQAAPEPKDEEQSFDINVCVNIPWVGQKCYSHHAYNYHPNDDLVSIASSHLEGATHLGNFDLNHHTVRTDVRVAQTICDVLEGKTASAKSQYKAQNTINNVNSPTVPPAIPESISYEGDILPGNTTTLTPAILAQSMSCILSWDTTESLAMVMTDSSGTQIPSSKSIVNGSNISYLNLQDIQSGQWSIQLIGNSLTAQAHYNLTIIMSGSLVSLNAATDKFNYKTGEAVSISADLKDNENNNLITGATVTARIVLPDGTVQNIALVDDGTSGDTVASDGKYANTTFIANLAGDYKVTIHAKGRYPDSSLNVDYENERKILFKGVSPDAVFNGSVTTSVEDTDGDGYYDNLVATVGVSVNKAGKYRLVGRLYNSSGGVVNSDVTNDMVQGVGAMQIRFDGNAIRQNGVNGPFILKNLILINENSDTLDEDLTEHATDAFTYNQFARDAIILTGINTDEGVDTDNNSLYNYLKITIGVDIKTAGYYSFNAQLFDANGTGIVWATGSMYLDAGAGTIPLNFDGQYIRASLNNGLFSMGNLAISGNGVIYDQQNVYTTSKSYNYQQFEQIDTDLVITSNDISFSKAVVFPGDVFKIKAAVKNVGKTTADTFSVGFYNGNPMSGGVFLGETAIAPAATQNPMVVAT